MTNLGIDIGGTSVKLAMMRDGQVSWTGRSETYERPTTEQLIAALCEAASQSDEPVIRADLAGLCVPGLLDRATRTITLSVNVPGLMGVRLDDLIVRAFGDDAIGELRIVNDAIAAAIDVYAIRSLRGRLLTLAIGTGVGAAVLDDGVPLLIEGDSPGHIGMLDVTIGGANVIGPDGGRGSLEGYIGAPVLRGRYALDRLTIDDLPMQALVRAIRICHAIYRPNHVVLLGGIGIRLRHLLEPIRAAVSDRLTGVARSDWTLDTGDSDFHAAIGAARRTLLP